MQNIVFINNITTAWPTTFFKNVLIIILRKQSPLTILELDLDTNLSAAGTKVVA